STSYGGPDFNGIYCNEAYGVLFKVNAAGSVNPFIPFTGANGAYPTALFQDDDGTLFGTTQSGGAAFRGGALCGGSGGYGTFFKADTNGNLTTLTSFGSTNNSPRGQLTLGPDGKFYGVTYNGGAAGLGTVFQISRKGLLKTIATFYGTNGANPNGG